MKIMLLRWMRRRKGAPEPGGVEDLGFRRASKAVRTCLPCVSSFKFILLPEGMSSTVSYQI
jgi:hypothetical protein